MNEPLSIKTYGTFSKPKLLFLHGALVDSSMWSEQIEIFKNDFYVMTCDLPEHGESEEKITDYSIPAIALLLDRVMEKLNITQMTICGHSLGGMVAQEYAANFPSKIDKLVLVETAYGTKTNMVEQILTFIAVLTIKITPASLLVKMSAKTYGKICQKSKNYITNKLSIFDSSQVKKIMGAALNYNGKENLYKIKADTLILVGSENKQTHKQAKIMNGIIENSVFKTISIAHHLVNIDNPEEFNNALWVFFKD